MKKISLLLLFSFFISSTAHSSVFNIKCLNSNGTFSDCKVEFEGSKITLTYKSKIHQILNEEIDGKSIKQIVAGEYQRRRVGEAIATGVLTFGLGAFLLLSKKKREHIAIEYVRDNTPKSTAFEIQKKYQLAFKMAIKAATGKEIIEAPKETKK